MKCSRSYFCLIETYVKTLLYQQIIWHYGYCLKYMELKTFLALSLALNRFLKPGYVTSYWTAFFASEVFTRSFLNIEQPPSPQGLFYLNKAASIIQVVTVMSVICIHDLTCLKSMKCGIYRKGFYRRRENIVCQEWHCCWEISRGVFTTQSNI